MATAATYGINSQQLKFDVKDRPQYLEPNKTALTLFLSRLKKGKQAMSTEPMAFEQRRIPDSTLIDNSGGYAAGATSIKVDDDTAQYAAPNYTVEVIRTGEHLLVTAIDTSAHTWTVTRGHAGTTAAAINDNDRLLIISGAAAEGSGANNSKSVLKDRVSNYLQIFRGDPFGMTRTMKQVTERGGTYAGNEWENQKREFALYHAVNNEKAYLWGKKHEITSGNTPQRFCGGVHEFISTNVSDFSGTLSLAALGEAMVAPGQHGSQRKVGLCSYRGFEEINQLAHDKIRITPATTSYGLRLAMLELSAQSIMLVPHKLFTDVREDTMYVLDMANFEERVLQPTILTMDIQNNDVDATQAEYLKEATIERLLEETHARIDNLYS
jgi:hypothetical protein